MVLALPFSTLRQVDLTRTDLSPLKRRAINELQLGTNAKITLQVAGRPWNAAGYTGNTLTDLRLSAAGSPPGPAIGVDGGWDSSNYQPGPTGILADFIGGNDGAALASKYGLSTPDGPAPRSSSTTSWSTSSGSSRASRAPGTLAPRLAHYHDGNVNPKLMGAWSQYNVGQYTGFSGHRARPRGQHPFRRRAHLARVARLHRGWHRERGAGGRRDLDGSDLALADRSAASRWAVHAPGGRFLAAGLSTVPSGEGAPATAARDRVPPTSDADGASRRGNVVSTSLERLLSSDGAQAFQGAGPGQDPPSTGYIDSGAEIPSRASALASVIRAASARASRAADRSGSSASTTRASR